MSNIKTDIFLFYNSFYPIYNSATQSTFIRANFKTLLF